MKLFFQMRRKRTIYPILTLEPHHFLPQYTPHPTGEGLDPPTNLTIVLAIEKTIRGWRPGKPLRRNMGSTGIHKSPLGQRVASLPMSDRSLFLLPVIPAVAKESWHKHYVTIWWWHNTFLLIRPGYIYIVFNIFEIFWTKTGGNDLRDHVIPFMSAESPEPGASVDRESIRERGTSLTRHR